MGKEKGYTNGASRALGWLVPIVGAILVLGIGGVAATTFSHESRISANETAVNRLDRLEDKMDRMDDKMDEVLQLVGAIAAKP